MCVQFSTNTRFGILGIRTASGGAARNSAYGSRLSQQTIPSFWNGSGGRAGWTKFRHHRKTMRMNRHSICFVYKCYFTVMRKFFLVLAVILVGGIFAVGESKAAIHIAVGVPGPVYYGPGYYPGYYYGPGYYAPGYYWGPYGYRYYHRPYWRHRYWRHHRWYWY
jgi:hypothetical protein